ARVPTCRGAAAPGRPPRPRARAPGGAWRRRPSPPRPEAHTEWAFGERRLQSSSQPSCDDPHDALCGRTTFGASARLAADPDVSRVTTVPTRPTCCAARFFTARLVLHTREWGTRWTPRASSY